MRKIVGLAMLLAAVSMAETLHAQGLTVEVRGVPGTNQTTWTFSGSYAVGNVSDVDDFYSLSGGGNAANTLNNFTHETGELSGGIGVSEIFNFHQFLFLSSTAQVVGSQSGIHLLDGIAIDSDDPITGDDFVWYAAGTFEDGETLTFSGTATIGLSLPPIPPTLTIALDIRQFLEDGVTFRSIGSTGATSTNPADFTMTFTDEVDEPSLQIAAIGAAVELLESGGALRTGLANALSAKLDAAISEVNDQPLAAANILGAFVNQVTALVRTGRLNAEDGASLISAAEDVIAGLTN